MAQENLLCIYQCLERAAATEYLLGDEAGGPTQSYYILFALGPRGLLDRALMEEAMEDLLASRQKSGTSKDVGEALRLGPFSGLSGVESMAMSLADRVGAASVGLLGAHEYNGVVENMMSWDGPQGAFFDTLFQSSQVLQESADRKSRKGLLGKIFN